MYALATKIRHLGINLSKDVKDADINYHKTLIKALKDTQNMFKAENN